MNQYQPYQQPHYPYQQQPPPHNNLPHSGDAPQNPSNADLGSWVLPVFLTMIPLVNIVYLLVLAFGDNTSIAKANFARATLIWTAVGIAVSIIFAVLLATAGVSIINDVLNEHSNEFNH